MKTFQNFSALFFVLFLFSSCVKQLDFDQVNDLSISPAYKSPLVYFTVNQTDFLLNTVEIPTITGEFPFTIIDNSLVKENLKEVELEFEINNQFSRDFTLGILLLDDNDIVTYSIPIVVINANTVLFTQKSNILIANNLLFLESTKIQFTISLLPSSDGLFWILIHFKHCHLN